MWLKNMKDKIDTAIKLLEEIKEEEIKEKQNVKAKVLDKLSNVECNYFLIICDSAKLIKNFKVYGMVADDYNKAYEMCEDLLDNDDFDDYWLLHKDELENMMFNIENKIIVREEPK